MKVSRAMFWAAAWGGLLTWHLAFAGVCAALAMAVGYAIFRGLPKCPECAMPMSWREPDGKPLCAMCWYINLRKKT